MRMHQNKHQNHPSLPFKIPSKTTVKWVASRPYKTKFKGHFVGTNPAYCKSSRIDDLSIESLSYRSLEMQFENLAGLGPFIL